jgi:hypothetical protein
MTARPAAPAYDSLVAPLENIITISKQRDRRLNIMTTAWRRITLLLALAVSLVTISTASGASPEPCKVLPAESWGSIMGYTATATSGDMNCTYQSSSKAGGGGGQFRIMANATSAAEAAASAKRMRDHQSHQSKGGHDPRLNVIDSQGTVVFSVAIFQNAATESTSSQLQKLVTVVKEHLPK